MALFCFVFVTYGKKIYNCIRMHMLSLILEGPDISNMDHLEKKNIIVKAFIELDWCLIDL